MSNLRSIEGMPWTDWITKHLDETYASLRGVAPAGIKPEEIVQIKENLRQNKLHQLNLILARTTQELARDSVQSIVTRNFPSNIACGMQFLSRE